MTTHVSVRLYWHDSGWNGAICRDPVANVWCEAHEHVRDNKDVLGEAANAGRPLDVASVMPGCEMSIQAFSTRRNLVRDFPPDWMKASSVQPIDRRVDPMSAPMWPYENMWDEDGGYKPNDERRRIAEEFFRGLEPGKSLAFLYVDERNPIFGDDETHAPHRLLVGVSRVIERGEIVEWDQPAHSETNMVWSVPFRHNFPADGIRLPVQALVSRVPDPEARALYAVALDEGLRSDFRYGSAAITLDRALAVLERAIAALARIRADGVLDTSVDSELEWLNQVLLELWDDRGPYPGIGQLLAALGCGRAAEIQRSLVPTLIQEGRDPAEELFQVLEGARIAEFDVFQDALGDAAFEWEDLGEEDRALARLLARMELDAEQMRAALLPSMRSAHRLPANAAEILENPYLLCERHTPRKDGERISFLTVDHALVPHESVASFGAKPVPRRDPRRLRALLTDFLRVRAEQGDTFAAAVDACEWATGHSPEDRTCDVTAERLATTRFKEVLDGTIEQLTVEGQPYLALHEVASKEVIIREVFDDLAERSPVSTRSVDWQGIADTLAESRRVEQLSLSSEQQKALDRSYRSPLSVITGAAGTGKSTLLAPLIAAIEREEGKVPIRALAPTGKAADRLKALGVEAMTMHRAIASAGWYDWDLGVWREEGDSKFTANTLIVDECSMVDVALLATLFRAVDWHSVRRLVLVGDHHQLPPIGPGRPFFDLINVMSAADQAPEPGRYANRLNELTHNYRVADGSRAIALANSFARVPEPDDALIWASLAKEEDLGDLRIRFWKDERELHALILEEIESLIQRECSRAGLDPNAWDAFDTMLGHGGQFDASHWQILGPVRGEAHGTRKLNAVIQDRFHGWAKRAKQTPYGAIIRWPVKLGDEQITSRDKVIQVSNERLYARDTSAPPGSKKTKHPIFNGQIGTVRGEYPFANHKYRKGQKGPVRSISVEFDGVPGLRFDYSSSGWQSVDRNLELAYALTVHKSQGSQFPHVFFVVPATAATFGRELAYTGLTRAQQTLTLLVERDVGPLLALSKRQAAKTPQRNSRLFATTPGALKYGADQHVFVSTRGDLVLSKSELIIANLLHQYERAGDLSYEYEAVLPAPGGEDWDFRLPDFTVHARGQVFYWEHCGMYGDPAYRKKWEEVRSPWYTRHGFADRLIVTYEGDTPGLRSDELEREVILGRFLARSP